MKSQNIFSQLQQFENEIARLEGKILELEQRMQKMIEIERNHLIRIKNKNYVPDEFILSGRSYMDLSPEKAWRQYSNPDFDFILLDVSAIDFPVNHRLPESLNIPYEELSERFMEISSKTTPILVISEDGTKSILACEFLVSRGYYNCSNVSGGHKFWKSFRIEKLDQKLA
jgi:rhodanese-related sulfurtransferase